MINSNYSYFTCFSHLTTYPKMCHNRNSLYNIEIFFDLFYDHVVLHGISYTIHMVSFLLMDSPAFCYYKKLQ